MSDQVALRRAICEQPEEDTPRLAYADWLDEHGGPTGAKRAAFIRREIADHRAERADTAANAFVAVATDHERTDWSAVDAELGARLDARKGASESRLKLTPKGEGLPRVKGMRYAGVERGFYNCVWAEDAATFLRHADAIFRAAPVTKLVLDCLDAEQASDLVRAGHLSRVRKLELLTQADPDAVRVLGASRDAAGVRDLEMRLSTNGPALAQALAAGRYWTGLHRLHTTNMLGAPNAVAGEAMTDLLAANPFPNVRELYLWAAQVTDDGAKLIARNFPELRFANLAINKITGAGAAALAASKSLGHLRHLDLAACGLERDSPAGTALVATNSLPNLTVLRVDGCPFRAGTQGLADAVRGPTLRSLTFNTAAFTPEGVEALVRCPAVRGLWHLELSNCGLRSEHVERFVRHAAFDRLAALDLSHNLLAGAGSVLAEWPGAAGLQWLDLRSSGVGEAGAKALVASPHLTGLKCVRFSGYGTAVMKRRFEEAFE